MTRVIVEEFDADIHGDCDDCDFVVSFTEGEGMEDTAERIAESLASDYTAVFRYRSGVFVKLLCCHS